MDRRPSSIFSTKPVATAVTTEIVEADILDQTSYPLTVTETPTVRATIVARKVTEEEIRHLGNNSAKAIATISSKVLEGHKNSDSGIMGDKLNELIKSAKGMNADNFKPGLVGNILNKFNIVKYDMMSQFDTANDKVTQLVGEIKKEADNQLKVGSSYDELIKANALGRVELLKEIDSAHEMLDAIGDEIASFTDDQLSADQARELEDARLRYDQAELKIVNLEASKALSTMMDPKLNAMKAAVASLGNTFDSIVNQMVPAYMLYFADYLNGIAVAKAGKLANDAMDTFDAIIKASGDQSAKNLDTVSKLKNRQMISVDTLRGEHEKMITSLNNLRANEELARQERAKAIVEIRDIEAKTIAAFTTREPKQLTKNGNSGGLK